MMKSLENINAIISDILTQDVAEIIMEKLYELYGCFRPNSKGIHVYDLHDLLLFDRFYEIAENILRITGAYPIIEIDTAMEMRPFGVHLTMYDNTLHEFTNGWPINKLVLNYSRCFWEN